MMGKCNPGCPSEPEDPCAISTSRSQASSLTCAWLARYPLWRRHSAHDGVPRPRCSYPPPAIQSQQRRCIITTVNHGPRLSSRYSTRQRRSSSQGPHSGAPDRCPIKIGRADIVGHCSSDELLVTDIVSHLLLDLLPLFPFVLKRFLLNVLLVVDGALDGFEVVR